MTDRDTWVAGFTRRRWEGSLENICQMIRRDNCWCLICTEVKEGAVSMLSPDLCTDDLETKYAVVT